MATQPAYIPEQPTRDWPGEPLRPRLAELAAGLDERFVRGGALLGEAIATIQTLLEGLGGMNRALDADRAAQALGQLRSTAVMLATLPDIIRHREAGLVAIAGLVRAVQGHVATIGRQIEIIGIYGMNIKIAGATGDFRIFVNEMAGPLNAGEIELKVFATRLQDVLQSLALVRKAYAMVLSAQSGMSGQIHQQLDECVSGLETHLTGTTALASQLETLAGRVQEGVGGVLAALQVADSTRQRIEHVVEAFGIMADAARHGDIPSGAQTHVACLLGNLIESASRDHAQQSQALRQSLSHLAAASQDLAALIDRRVAGDGSAALHDLETGISALGAMITQLTETSKQAGVMEGCIADATDDLTTRLDSIDQIVRDVKAIAINTRLLCLRQGQTGAAVAVIAVEVAGQATQLRETANHIATDVDSLAQLNQSLRENADHGETDLGAVLNEARLVIAQACQDSDSGLAGSETIVKRLMVQVADAGAVIGDSDNLADQLQPAVRTLSGPRPVLDSADEAWLRNIMPKIHARYTMAAERQIHADFALPGGDATLGIVDASPPADCVEQDEDGLF